MSVRNTFGVLCVVFCFAACAAQSPPPAEEAAIDIAAEEQAIRDASMAWLEATQGRDGATADTFLLANVTTMFDGEVFEGLSAVQMNREQEWAENPDFSMMWVPDDIGVAASGDLGYEHGTWTYDADGEGEMTEAFGQYLTVWQKVGDQWKVLYDAGTTIQAGEEMEEE